MKAQVQSPRVQVLPALVCTLGTGLWTLGLGLTKK